VPLKSALNPGNHRGKEAQSRNGSLAVNRGSSDPGGAR
jgi:hypothetical protein